jgi:hypothetical protein
MNSGQRNKNTDSKDNTGSNKELNKSKEQKKKGGKEIGSVKKQRVFLF